MQLFSIFSIRLRRKEDYAIKQVFSANISHEKQGDVHGHFCLHLLLKEKSIDASILNHLHKEGNTSLLRHNVALQNLVCVCVLYYSFFCIVRSFPFSLYSCSNKT